MIFVRIIKYHFILFIMVGGIFFISEYMQIIFEQSCFRVIMLGFTVDLTINS
jgi:hypothetical protein